MNLTEYLYEKEKTDGAAIAFREGKKSYSFHEMAGMTRKTAAALSGAGIGKETKILLLEPLSVRMYVLLLAIWQLGASVILFDGAATPAYVEKCLSRVRPDWFIGSRKALLLRFKMPCLKTIRRRKSSNFFFHASGRQEPQHPETAQGLEQLPALITFTSGTTGTPKAAVRTQNFLTEQFRVISRTMPYEKGDVDLALLPVFTLANIAGGITTVIPDKSIAACAVKPPEKVVRQLEECRVSRITGSPAIVGALAECLLAHGKDLPGVTKLFVGGGPIYRYSLQTIARAFPNAKMKLVYGSTEAEPIAELDAEELTEAHFQKMASGGGLMGGRVIPEISCRVVCCNEDAFPEEMTQEAFDTVTSAHGVGEIVVSGRHVLGGYLDGAGDRDTKFDVDGTRWHRTGDLGYFDDDGLLWLLGRQKAAITDARGTVYPFAVESAVISEYGLRHACLLQSGGKRVLVMERPAGGAAQQESEAEQNTVRERYQLDEVLWIDRMPMDIRHHAKVNYEKLHQTVAIMEERQGEDQHV